MALTSDKDVYDGVAGAVLCSAAGATERMLLERELCHARPSLYVMSLTSCTLLHIHLHSHTRVHPQYANRQRYTQRIVRMKHACRKQCKAMCRSKASTERARAS